MGAAAPRLLPQSGDEPLMDAVLSPDGRAWIEASQGSSTARVLDIASGRELLRLEAQAGQVWRLAWRLDGAAILT
jgi:hypothetical protein